MRDADVIFEWSVWPLGAEPKRALLFGAAVILIPLLIALRFGSTIWLLVAPVFLLGSLNRFWIPQHYRVSDAELEFRRWWFRKVYRLADFKRAVYGVRTVFLSPFAEPHRLDPYRGLWVQLDGDAQEFKRFLDPMIPRAER